MSDHHHGDQHGAQHHHGHDESHGESLAALLELDAIVTRSYLEAATGWAAKLVDARRVLDVGSGVGAATIALAGVFPHSSIIALDTSTELLARVADRAADGGVGDRVTTVQADLTGNLPVIGEIDLIWASSVLHELADAEAVLGRLVSLLSNNGVLVVVEMDMPPTFLPEPALEARIHELVSTLPFSHPTNLDWSEGLERSGLTIIERRSFVVDEVPVDQSSAAAFAHTYLDRTRPRIADQLAPADRDALDAMLAPDGPRSLRVRTDLHVRGSRTAWAGRRTLA